MIKQIEFDIIYKYEKIGRDRHLKFEEIVKKLADAGVQDARFEAGILIEEMCGERVCEGREYDDALLEDALEKRTSGYPLQYIIGKWWFARCEFEVDENCLIPRPDTESVVEEAVKILPHNASFADLCTGSGCIAVSVADLRPDTRGVAVDLYPKTLDIAKRNARRNNVADRLAFILGDVLSGDVLGEEKFSAIISNPPYIRRGVIDTLSREVSFEPRVALDGGEDGLAFYRAIVGKYQKNLDTDGRFIFEIGYDQAEGIRAIAADNGFSCNVKKDLGGNYRVAVLEKRNNPSVEE